MVKGTVLPTHSYDSPSVLLAKILFATVKAEGDTLVITIEKEGTIAIPSTRFPGEEGEYD